MSAHWERWLDAASIDRSVALLRPDYRALVVIAEGLRGGPSDADSEVWLTSAEAAEVPLDHPHLEAWRESFRAFGANPRKSRPSVDALVRRPELPRIDRITDIYNALSVLNVVPAGGENLDAYSGPLRLTRATGTEEFDTVADGETIVEHPEVGEVIWRDDAGVTCRRWNWRQCVRTRLSPETVNAVFIFDALGPMADDELVSVGVALEQALGGEATTFGSRLIRAE